MRVGGNEVEWVAASSVREGDVILSAGVPLRVVRAEREEAQPSQVGYVRFFCDVLLPQGGGYSYGLLSHNLVHVARDA